MTREEIVQYINSELAEDEPEIYLDIDDYKVIAKVLEQEPILDKIRAEIEELDRFYDNDYFSGNRNSMFKCNEVMEILDKYKAESEE